MTAAAAPAHNEFKLTPNFPVLALGLMLLPLLLWLSIWQLGRAAEKEILLQRHSLLTQQAPIDISTTAEQPLADFTPVLVTGNLASDRYWLLDNKVQHGKVGYEVLQALTVTGDKTSRWVLINRGWVAGSYRREQLPQIDLITHRLTVVGQIAAIYDNPLITDSNTDVSWPRRINAIDLKRMSAEFGAPLWQLINLSADSPAALSTQWPAINVSPQKHLGYALQWFCMAIALLILLAFANTNLTEYLRARNRQREKK